MTPSITRGRRQRRHGGHQPRCPELRPPAPCPGTPAAPAHSLALTHTRRHLPPPTATSESARPPLPEAAGPPCLGPGQRLFSAPSLSPSLSPRPHRAAAPRGPHALSPAQARPQALSAERAARALHHGRRPPALRISRSPEGGAAAPGPPRCFLFISF